MKKHNLHGVYERKITKGIYVLIIELPENTDIHVGKLGTIKFQKGFYAYTGSALNGLSQRIERHLRKNKKFHWHIDYLLDKSDVLQVIYAKTSEKMECKIAGNLLKNSDVRTLGGKNSDVRTSGEKNSDVRNSGKNRLHEICNIAAFGSSDCKCRSHLLFCRDFNYLNTLVLNAFTENRLDANEYASEG